MTEAEKQTFVEYLTKLVENNDSSSVMKIVEEMYGGDTHHAIVLARLAAVSQALTNSKPFNFYKKYAHQPLLRPSCLGCNGPIFNGTIHPELPTVGLCDCCQGYISLGQKIEKDKTRILESLTLVIEESKTLCGEPEEGCARCDAVADVSHLVEAIKCIRK